MIISAEDELQADKILTALLKKRIVIGGLVVKAPAKFWWKGKVLKMDYLNIQTFTLSKHKAAVICEVRKYTAEEVPMVAFFPLEANIEFFQWISKTLK